jgi:hypothetical protein
MRPNSQTIPEEEDVFDAPRPQSQDIDKTKLERH